MLDSGWLQVVLRKHFKFCQIITQLKKKKLTFSPCPPPHPPPTPLHTHIHTADRDFTGAFQLPLDPSDVICSISLMGTDALGN